MHSRNAISRSTYGTALEAAKKKKTDQERVKLRGYPRPRTMVDGTTILTKGGLSSPDVEAGFFKSFVSMLVH